MPTLKIEAIIYDLDGTLIDSEDHWQPVNQHFFAKRGMEFTPELHRQVAGGSILETMQRFKVTFGWSETPEDLRAELLSMTEEIYRALAQPIAGAEELIRATRQQIGSQAIASGSSARRVTTVVDRLRWQPHFDYLASCEEVGNKGKPDPAVFLYAAQKIDVHPSQCVVIEDSENGVRAAKAAGMRCIAVPYKKSIGNFSYADLVVESLTDERLQDWLGLI